MLTSRLRELLNQAIAGDAEAFQAFQIEKLKQFAEVQHQSAARLEYFENLEAETVKYVLQHDDISNCSSKLLYYVLISIYNEHIPQERKAMEISLSRATLKCTENSPCNLAGISTAVLFFKTFFTKEMPVPSYNQLLLLQADDKEGVTSCLQAMVLSKVPDFKDKAIAKFKQSIDKKNELACFKFVEFLYMEEDLSELDKHNEKHKLILRHLRRAAAQGCPGGYYMLGEIFLAQKTNDDIARKENQEAAINYLMQGIDARDPNCFYRLAYIYFTRFPEDTARHTEAHLLLKDAIIKFRHIDSMLLLANICMRTKAKNAQEQAAMDQKALELLNHVIAKHNCPTAMRLKEELMQRLPVHTPPILKSIIKVPNPQKSSSTTLTGNVDDNVQPPKKRPRKVRLTGETYPANGNHTQTTSVVISALAALPQVSSNQVASTTDYRLYEEDSYNGKIATPPQGNLNSYQNGLATPATLPSQNGLPPILPLNDINFLSSNERNASVSDFSLLNINGNSTNDELQFPLSDPTPSGYLSLDVTDADLEGWVGPSSRP